MAVEDGLRHCSGCRLSKGKTEFYKHPTGSEGLSHHCKECIKAAQAERRAKNRKPKKARPKPVGFRKHGHRGMVHTSPEYQSWRSMRTRCNNPNTPYYKNYGGRGIKVCDEWDDFKKFLEHIGPRPEGTTLDRINVEGDYEPGNVRWATHDQQLNNKRNNKKYKAFGHTGSLKELADKYNMPFYLVDSRVRSLKWPIEKALTTPKGPNGGANAR